MELYGRKKKKSLSSDSDSTYNAVGIHLSHFSAPVLENEHY